MAPYSVSRTQANPRMEPTRPDSPRGLFVIVAPTIRKLRGIMTNARAAFLARGFALTGAFPFMLLLAVMIVSEVPNFFDPCFVWGAKSGQSVSIHPSDSCQGITSTSETRWGAIGRLLFIQGTGIVAACLGLIGAIRSRPRVTLLGAGLLLILSIPLMLGGFGIIVLLLSVVLFISYHFTRLARTAVS